MILSKAGVVLTKSLIERLQKNSIVQVSVVDEADEIEGILENG